MKKRIMSIFLAVVMVLAQLAASGVGFTASANTTAARTLLHNYVNGNPIKNLESDIHTYGTRSMNNFSKALDYSKLLLDVKTNVTEEEYISAYYMLRTAANTRNLYKCTTLSTCQAKFKDTYETGNIFNQDADLIYTSTSWTSFKNAYDAVTENIHPDDSQFVTNLCNNLTTAFNNLDEKIVVTWSQYTQLNSRIEDIISLDLAQGRNRFTDERRPNNFLKNHDHISITCESTARWGTAWKTFDIRRPSFNTERANFQARHDTSTTADKIVEEYLLMKKIVDYIDINGEFKADDIANANVQDFRAVMRDFRDRIVSAQNNPTNSVNIEINPRDGSGALKALYEKIAEDVDDSGFWVSGAANGTAGNNPIRPKEDIFIVYDNTTNAYLRAALSSDEANRDADKEGIQMYAKNSTPDLRKYIEIGLPADTPNAWQISLPTANPNTFNWFVDSNNGNVRARTLNEVLLMYKLAFQLDKTTSQSARDTMTREFWETVTGGNNASGGMTNLATSASGTWAFAYRCLMYTLDDYTFPSIDYYRTRTQLVELVNKARDCCLTRTQAPFFKDCLDEINKNRDDAVDILARSYTNHETADGDDRKDYYVAFVGLRAAIDCFHSNFDQWPYSVHDAYRLILDAHKSGNGRDILLAEILAYEILIIDRTDSNEVWIAGNDVLLYGRLANIFYRPEYRAYLACYELDSTLGTPVQDVCSGCGVTLAGGGLCDDCTVEPGCNNCGICEDCKVEPDCTNCKKEPCECIIFLEGRILAGDNRRVSIGDAMEIMKYLGRIPSLVKEDNPREWNAAMILQASKNTNKPGIGDAMEIMKELGRIPSAVPSHE